MNGLLKKPLAWLGVSVMAVTLFGGATLAQAEQLTPRQAFEHADTNNDSAVDVEEFRRRKIEIFMLMDTNGDGFIVIGEVADEHKGKFATVDRNKDGRASLNEYLVFVMPAFWLEYDTNKDTVLTMDEVEAATKKN